MRDTLLQKKFLREAGGADTYPNLEVKFIKGANPDLIVFNEQGEEEDRVDLTTATKTIEDIHVLLAAQGIDREL